MTDPQWVGLQNVEKSHCEAPRTFSIPRLEQRVALKVGDLVKLVFESDRPSTKGFTAERMWVEVREVRAADFVGALDNQPSFLANLQPGDLIEFGPEHVAALDSPPSGLQLPLGQFALVSRDLLGAGAFPTEAYRQVPASSDSSGWVVVSEHGATPGLVPMLVDDLVAAFRILDSILDEPVGSRWKWDPDRLEYASQPSLV